MKSLFLLMNEGFPSPGSAVRPIYLAISLAILLLAGVVGMFSWQLREKIRQGLVEQTAAVLYPMIVLQIDQAREDLVFENEETVHYGLFSSVLSTVEMEGVAGVQIFDQQGKLFDTLPVHFLPIELPATVLERMQRFETETTFVENISGEAFFLSSEKLIVPAGRNWLLVRIPLHARNERQLLGIAQLLLQADELAADLQGLDRQLWLQAVIAWLGGSMLLILAVWWAFQNLERTNRLLAERSQRLAEANRQLFLNAKTAAIGAISAHLIHGLKNPLAGLRDYMNTLQQPGEAEEEETRLAREAAQRMQNMIQEITAVLREETAGEVFDFSLAELAALALAKVRPLAEQKMVRLECNTAPDGLLDSRRANLVLLILANLLQNAIEATPPQGLVQLQIECDPVSLRLRVVDSGPGLPENMRRHPFQVNTSSKAGGTGLGLAISEQMAKQIGAELSLERTGAEGTVFMLQLKKH